MARFVGKGERKVLENKEEVNFLQASIDKMLIRDCVSFKGIDIYPILIEEKTNTTLITLDEALKSQKAEVLEIGVVNEVIIKNKSLENSILILEGTIVKGGKQNRVINTTLILDKESEYKVPTTCVEQSRWSYNVPSDFFTSNSTLEPDTTLEFNNHFLSSGYLSPTMYCSLNKSVNKGLSSGNYCANQGEMWNEIQTFNSSLDVKSSTNDYTKVFRDKEKEINEYYEKFKEGLDNIVFNGLLAIIKGKKMFLNFSCDPEIMDVRLKPFIESIVVESFNLEQVSTIEPQKMEEFLNLLPNIAIKTYKNKSGDLDIRFDDKDVVGSYYIHDNDLIFLTVVKDIQFRGQDEDIQG